MQIAVDWKLLVESCPARCTLLKFGCYEMYCTIDECPS